MANNDILKQYARVRAEKEFNLTNKKENRQKEIMRQTNNWEVQTEPKIKNRGGLQTI